MMLATLNEDAGEKSYVSLRRNVYFGAQRFSTVNTVPNETLSQGRNFAPEDRDLSRTKVLVVDDEQVIANTLTIILNTSGFEARAVYSGEAAVQSLGSFQPDVLICDVVMGGMSGIDAAITFRSQRPSCKILLFSGQAATADLLQVARAQGHDFEIMTKPIHPLDLLAKLRVGNVF